MPIFSWAAMDTVASSNDQTFGTAIDGGSRAYVILAVGLIAEETFPLVFEKFVTGVTACGVIAFKIAVTGTIRQ